MHWCMLMQMQYVITLLKTNINPFVENEKDTQTETPLLWSKQTYG